MGLLYPLCNQKVTSPIFYQHVIDFVFKSLVKQRYQLSESTSGGTQSSVIKRKNALWFVAGCMWRKVKEKLESSTHIGKEDMVLCLM